MAYFDKEKDLMLIEMVKNRPCLHDRSVLEYRDPIAKSIAWQEICQDLYIPMPEIRKRWIQLFDIYLKASKSTEDETRQRSESNEEDIREYLPLLSFLTPKTKVRQKKIIIKGFINKYSENFERQFHADRLKLIEVYVKTKLGSNNNSDQLKNQNAAVNEDNSIDMKRENKTSEFGSIFKTEDFLNEKDEKGFRNNPKNAEIENLEFLNENMRKSEQSSTDCYFYNETDDLPQLTSEDYSNNFDECATDFMSNFKNDLSSCLEEIEKCKEFSGCGPIHKFFEEVACIIAMVPPHLALEAIKMVNTVANDIIRHRNNRSRHIAKRKRWERKERRRIVFIKSLF